MARIEFNVKYRPQIESGEYKVVTRGGRPVRIVCWDAKGNFPVTILLDFDNSENAIQLTKEGRFFTSADCHSSDLFIITPDQELTEFEKEICGVSNLNLNYDMKEEVRAAAAHILALARKQIIKEAEEKAANEGYGIEDAVAFNEGFKTAKELYSRTEEKIAKRLPTIEEWKWLIENCEWKWDDVRNGQIVTAPNGNSIFLPVAGRRNGTSLYDAGSFGYYWSSSLCAGNPRIAYDVGFNSDDMGWYCGIRYYGQSVRPVSDTQQEGFVDMGNGVFWAPENERGYYTYDEAMKLFNDCYDESIRKHIIDIIKDNAKSKCIPCDAEIAYLEKQKEQ